MAALTSRGIFSALLAAFAPSAARLRRALADPEQAQRERLAAVLRSVAGTDQARRFGLSRVHTAYELRDAVPIQSPETVAPHVERLFRGEKRVLTRHPVVRFELSGGSSGPSRMVPITAPMRQELHAALGPWLHDLLSRRPALRAGRGYWSLSPAAGRAQVSPAGIPVLSADDRDAVPRTLQPLMDRALAVPASVGSFKDVESCRYATLWHLVAAENLAMISVWNPSFLTLLVQRLDAWAPRLARELERGTYKPPNLDAAPTQVKPLPDRARALRAAFGNDGTVDVGKLWPALSMISLWMHAEAGRLIGDVRERFRQVELQPKGLVAAEGVVSVPLLDAPAPVLALRSHFYEFLDDAGRVHLAHELVGGRTYDVLLSTSGGLLRYRLGDRVKVEGFIQRAPCLAFVGRSSEVCDLAGEKLAAARVREVLERCLPPGVRFAMLAPEWVQPPAYALFIESKDSDDALKAAAAKVEAGLCEGHAYGYARRLGQLGPVGPIRVYGATARYEARCVAMGQRASHVKPMALHHSNGWREALEGRLL